MLYYLFRLLDEYHIRLVQGHTDAHPGTIDFSMVR